MEASGAPTEDAAAAASADETPRVPAGTLAKRSVVLDCRWLGYGGAGRVTELLLAELRQAPPFGRWTLWGSPARIEPLAFDGARIEAIEGDPHAFFGQRALLRVPRGDVVLYLHQIRPLRPGPSVTVIHDTIPLRYGGNRALRLVKHAFFFAAARLTAHVLTDSELSKEAIVRDLRVPARRISVMRFPVDAARARRVADVRAATGQRDVLLYVGRFDTHKNLHRLCEAFARTRFAASGGELELVGGGTPEVRALTDWLRDAGIERVRVRGACSETELDHLLATSRALIAPALEEGYGLPAFEAAASGLPVAASRTGAMPELGAAAVLFDPWRTDEMTAAIDEVTARAAGPPTSFSQDRLREPVLRVLAAALAEACPDE